MAFLEAFRIALNALRIHKLRSALTMLGMIIGVGSVVALLAFGNGYGRFLDEQFDKLGVGAFYLFPGSITRKINDQPTPRLTAADAAALRDATAAPAIRTSAALIENRATVSAGAERFTFNIMGAEPPYFDITNQTIALGRIYTNVEEESRARVAVIGSSVAEQLYGATALAPGRRITINGVGFEVIGVIDTSATFTGDPKRTIFMPYRSAHDWLFRNQFDRRVDVSEIIIQAQSREQVQEAIRQATEVIRARHGLTYQNNGFTVFNLEDLANQIGAVVAGFNAFLGVVAGISLLVGGIGIMNIMLVSVTERTREIGLRKAVGAKRLDILWQFLIEALVLSLFGGLAGVLLGYALSPLGTLLLQGMGGPDGTSGAAATVTLDSVALAVGVASSIGLFFGIYPAWIAARLRPIDALRSE